MQANPSRDLDSLIDGALRAESLRPTPPGFHARIERRLRVAAVIEQERREFRARVMARTALVAVAAIGLLALGAGLGLPQWVATVPGGLGYCDYAWTSAAEASSPLMASARILALICGGIAAVLAGLPLVRVGMRVARVGERVSGLGFRV